MTVATPGIRTPATQAVRGAMLAALAMSLFSVQDAFVKAMSEDYSVVTILFFRSLGLVPLVCKRYGGALMLAFFRKGEGGRWRENVCSGSQAEVSGGHRNVRSWGNSGHCGSALQCLLVARSGHSGAGILALASTAVLTSPRVLLETSGTT